MSAYHLLVNGAAGAVEQSATDDVREVLEAAGTQVVVSATASPDEVEGVLTGLTDDELLVVCGGDGSLHLAVDRLRALDRLDVPVGLVALGTGNDLARGLGLPVDDAGAAARGLLDGRARPLDLLVDDTGRIAVNALHAGVGADAAARAEALKDQLSHVAYPLGAVLAGVTAAGARTRVTVDDEILLVDDEVLLVAVCNGSGFGGGTPAAPDADPSDGLLDVMVTTATGPVARAAFARALSRGEHLERDDVHLARGQQVRIIGDGLRYDVDGEVGGSSEPERTWRVAPDAWYLIR